MSYFETELDMPVFVAPLANVRGNYGCDLSDYEYNKIVLAACKKENVLAFTGDGVDIEEFLKSLYKQYMIMMVLE